MLYMEFERYAVRGRPGCGVWSVSLAECATATVVVEYAVPLEDDIHAVVNFNELGAKAQWD